MRVVPRVKPPSLCGTGFLFSQEGVTGVDGDDNDGDDNNDDNGAWGVNRYSYLIEEELLCQECFVQPFPVIWAKKSR